MDTLTLPGLGPPPPEPVARAHDADGALHELFGFASFRPGQREAVEAVTAPHPPRDVLVVMPTGSGKSLCYQLPALMRADLTVVVSPLVSLMQDQVEAVERVAPGFVGLINAQQDAARNRKVLARAAAGRLRLLYIAPERFASPGFLERIREARIGLFVVDEAHCVSQWGHDFRPDYFRLADAARWLGAEAIVASTATATPQVAADIVARLALRDPVRVATGFDRPNLSFAVVPVAAKHAAHQAIGAALAEPGALPAIVYAGTRSDCERLAARLGRELAVEAIPYHAGLPREARAEAQRRFMSGAAPVVVATNAFGMGVDKADVRTVCHESVPGSIEAYYQEAGRAGRDGLPARCLLFAASRDKGLHVHFIERATVTEDALKGVARRIVAAAETFQGDGAPRFDLGVGELSPLAGDEEAVRATVGHLARAGVVQPSPSPPDRIMGRLVGAWDGRALGECRTAAQEATRARWRQYRAVWAWVEGERCRREGILRHFGDATPPAPHGSCCDVCDPGLAPETPAAARGAAGGGLRPLQLAHRPEATGETVALDDAIIDVVAAAEPSVGRTRAVEILRGGRSKALLERSCDGLPHYGEFAHLAAAVVLERVDALLSAGTLRSSGGRYPTLEPV
ncbi:MAG: ATP-dependent helicase RecQ [Solirubrobacteraceae bacterium]|nr:ATP-dependent helicase RecQ [Solirubrobacteraceae bacterium]